MELVVFTRLLATMVNASIPLLDGLEISTEQLEDGMIGVNQGVGGSGEAPWVGAKQSGFGFHGSPEGHRQFAQVRVLSR